MIKRKEKKPPKSEYSCRSGATVCTDVRPTMLLTQLSHPALDKPRGFNLATLVVREINREGVRMVGGGRGFEAVIVYC